MDFKKKCNNILFLPINTSIIKQCSNNCSANDCNSIHFNLPTTINFKLQSTTTCYLPTTDYQLPTTNYRLPTTRYLLITTYFFFFKLSASSFRFLLIPSIYPSSSSRPTLFSEEVRKITGNSSHCSRSLSL